MLETGITVDPNLVQRLVDQAVENNINTLVDQICADPGWQIQVERLINQHVVQETLTRLGSIDLGPTIKHYVDDYMKVFTTTILKDFASTGILDQATKCELTIMDDAVVVEDCLIAKNIEAMESAKIKNLVVTGSINTDNASWSALAAEISRKTLEQVTTEWTQTLVDDVAQQIKQQGIAFENINVGEEPLIKDGELSKSITMSNLQTVGILKTLMVKGEARFNNTLNVLNKRLGINTDAPEKALSIWDEEVSVVIGKHKINQAYIGTNRDQGVSIGVNREPQIEISVDGLTTVKRLQVGSHKISHDVKVPGWSATRGDLVINSNPGSDRVFAWICLGGHKWQALKSAE